MGAYLSFNSNKAKFPVWVASFIISHFLTVSCTIWPVLTGFAIPSKSSNGNGNESIELLLLLQHGNRSGGSGSSTGPGSSGPPASSCANNGGCSIFLSTATTGNFGGVSGADARCATDAIAAGAPGSPSDYKALIMADDGSRTLTTNWVLWPNTIYKTMSNSNLTISTTNASAMFSFPLSNLFVPSGGNAMYTGIDASGATWVPKSGVTCTNAGVSWSSASNTVSGWVGVTSGTDKTLVDVGGGTGFTCDNFLLIYCVQK
ncbi:DUF1554 domain-containing protein [Leptospira kmetyi]|uniref:DUF1554 domain-containing protein n=1 Tax=Leptospira kmetyi TaxID=408139 RepID=UPI0010826866|nr:DUF1554 domain-containing protein [Leptospira kmetyi]TGK15878.1 DUF1554 domain-containing protein [Leptospira kmetyi]TGK31908.1 DUF1554 domain-containing protein [Leptospira kmetyi]